jgi:hypothetical protein
MAEDCEDRIWEEIHRVPSPGQFIRKANLFISCSKSQGAMVY